MKNTTANPKPEIIEGEVIEPNPAQFSTWSSRLPITPPVIVQPQDVPPLVSLAVGIAIYEGIRWMLWRYYDHLSDS